MKLEGLVMETETTVFCITCARQLDKAPNASMMQGTAEDHVQGYEDHKVIVGNVFKKED